MGVKNNIISKDAQKIAVKKLNSNQIFVLLVLLILSVMFYFMFEKQNTKMDETNSKLASIISLNEQNLLILKNHRGINR